NPGTDKESAVSGEFLEVSPPDRLVQTFGMEGPYGKPFTQTIELERVGDGTRLAITSRFDTTEERDGVVAYGAEKGAIGGWARLDALLKRLAAG
ncbi:MAG TPA: SRPBCC domain-containing protein, partial [Candidatus Saccharimonadales bacterium]|nr:SRPBCC domain-containing protein [Candidatus Saccharimonadales bacterium]